ncbi:MAG: serine/threonine-protein kinase [Polyangia bacterium]
MAALNPEPIPAATGPASGPPAGAAPPPASAASATAPAPASAPAEGTPSLSGQKVGKYLVKREIGRGGMGAVYEAVHESIGQRIAIKVLNEELSLDARHVQRFFDEARAVNIVQHPGLVKVYDFGHLESGTAYITMEFLAGESLQDRLNRLRNGGTWLQLHEALRISRQIASALEAVHGKNIAHRDLKPGGGAAEGETPDIVPEPRRSAGNRTGISAER